MVLQATKQDISRVQTEQSEEEHARGGGTPVLRRAGQTGGLAGEFTVTRPCC